MVILGQLLFDRARAMEEPSRRCGRSFFAISGGHVASTRDFAGGMWQTYIKGGRINLSPNPRGFSCRRCRSLASVIGLRSMSSSGPIQLPQAQAKSTSQALPQQKPLSLPTQSKGIDSTSSNGSKEDGKPDVKDTPSVPQSITEQTLSSMHGIVPTLQYVLSQISGQANTEQKYCGNGKPRSEIGFKNHCTSRTEC